MSSWLDKPADELISSWGAPDTTIERDDGGRVLTWITISAAEGNVYTCRQSFTVNSAGIVEQWSYNGCPAIQFRLW
ncbi:MAG: hypothetical protein ACYTAN_16205 [Planctomycetota bacterium]